MVRNPELDRRYRVLWSNILHNGYDVIDAYAPGQPIVQSFKSRGDAEQYAEVLNGTV
jgi:hypothetical protein